MRIIAHLDMDAFFAAVEERDNPRLVGLPVVVGSDPLEGKGRGVVSTANYLAREYGIRSGMPITRAWQLSEAAVRRGRARVAFCGANHEKYGRVSFRILELARARGFVVETASIDEFYIDLSSLGSFSDAILLCEEVQREISLQEKLTASIGVGPNKLVAKIASDFRKPQGLTAVCEHEAESFLEALSVRVLPGVGPKTEIVLRKMKIAEIRDLKALSFDALVLHFGKWGADLYYKARGQDDSIVVSEVVLKSIGEQETFSHDTLDASFLFDYLSRASREVVRRFIHDGFRGFRAVVIVVRFADFSTCTRSRKLSHLASSYTELFFEVMKLFTPFLDSRENPRRKLIRLLGVRILKLV